METLTEVFNRAFSDYFIPFRLTPEQLSFKLYHEGVDLALSVGAFVEQELVGFIYHADGIYRGRRTFYNAGTGVVPAFRGYGLTMRMYDHIVPKLKVSGFHAGVLEVITENAPAIRNYERLGFKKIRKVHILKGTPDVAQGLYEVEEVSQWDWNVFRVWWTWPPTWQNQPMCIDRMKDGVRCLVIRNEGTPVAYAIVNRDRNRIRQWGVHPDFRRQKMGIHLFSHVAQTGGEIELGNVDLGDLTTRAFLIRLGFTSPLQQWEMRLEL